MCTAYGSCTKFDIYSASPIRPWALWSNRGWYFSVFAFLGWHGTWNMTSIECLLNKQVTGMNEVCQLFALISICNVIFFYLVAHLHSNIKLSLVSMCQHPASSIVTSLSPAPTFTLQYPKCKFASYKNIWDLTLQNAFRICIYVQIHPPSCSESPIKHVISLAFRFLQTLALKSRRKEEIREFLFLCMCCILSSDTVPIREACLTFRFCWAIPCLDLQ